MIRRAVWVLALPLVLGGCTSDDGKKPTVLPSLAPPAASPSVAPVPSVPTEASAETSQGASAFVRHYFEVVNGAYANSDASAVANLSDSGCNACRNIVEDVTRLRQIDHRVAGDRFKLDFAETRPEDAEKRVIVDFRFSSDAYVEVDASGGVVQNQAAQTAVDGQARLARTDGRWLLFGIRLIDS